MSLNGDAQLQEHEAARKHKKNVKNNAEPMQPLALRAGKFVVKLGHGIESDIVNLSGQTRVVVQYDESRTVDDLLNGLDKILKNFQLTWQDKVLRASGNDVPDVHPSVSCWRIVSEGSVLLIE